MAGGSPGPTPSPPKKPERSDPVKAQDIILGGADELGDTRKKGKKSLLRPGLDTGLVV